MRVSYDGTQLPDPGPTAAGLTLTPSNGGESGPAGSGVTRVATEQDRPAPLVVQEVSRDLQVLAEVDVLVCGGGPAGTAAAIAAARAGSRTLLVERYGFLGGMATAGLVVPHFDPYLNEGINAEVIQQLESRGGWGADGWKISFDPELWKHVTEELVLSSGSDLLYHTFVVAALVDGDSVRGVVVETKSGRFAILAKVVVDCTGDGDVAARAGATVGRGRPEDGLMQPMTTMFRLGGVSWIQPNGYRLRDLIEAAVERTGHPYRLPYEHPWSIHLPNPGEVAVMLVHVRDVDATNVRDMTRAEIDGRRQTLTVVDFMRSHLEEFADAYLIETATQIGVRETRRIMGDYVLTADDLIHGRSFPDSIATVSFGIDIHSPDSTKSGGMRIGTEGGGRRGAYDIPYRCLLPRSLEQLLVAGRCISGTFEAHASYRVKGPCMAMGQAAGVAASLACRTGTTPRDLPVADLHRGLRDQGYKVWSIDGAVDVSVPYETQIGLEPAYRPRRASARQQSAYRGPG